MPNFVVAFQKVFVLMEVCFRRVKVCSLVTVVPASFVYESCAGTCAYIHCLDAPFPAYPFASAFVKTIAPARRTHLPCSSLPALSVWFGDHILL